MICYCEGYVEDFHMPEQVAFLCFGWPLILLKWAINYVNLTSCSEMNKDMRSCLIESDLLLLCTEVI
jgi:hypothetical protein